MKIEEIREIVKNYTLLSELARDYAKLHFRYAPITDMAERVVCEVGRLKNQHSDWKSI